MADSSVSVENAGLRGAGLNAELVRDELNTFRNGGLIDLVRLPPGALGLIGLPAALRHNMGVDDYATRLGHGADSAEWLARTLKRTDGNYLRANDAAIQTLLAQTAQVERDVHTDYRVIPEKLIEKDYTANWLGHTIQQSDFSEGYEPRLRANEVVMGVAGAYAGGRLGVSAAQQRMVMNRPGVVGAYSPSSAAKYSEMVKARLNVAKLLSPSILVAVAIFAAIEVRDDFEIDQTVGEWRTLAAWMSGVFGAGDPLKREALAKAWDSSSHDAADLKLRDFVTAGIQLTDRAVAKFDALRKAVVALNELYKAILATTTVETAVLMGLSVAAHFSPAAFVMKERFALRFGLTFAAFHAAVAAFYGWKMWHEMGDDSATAQPYGVKGGDFPSGA